MKKSTVMTNVVFVLLVALAKLAWEFPSTAFYALMAFWLSCCAALLWALINSAVKDYFGETGQ